MRANLVLKNIDPEGVERNQSYANNYYDESHYWMCFPGAWNFLPDNKISLSCQLTLKKLQCQKPTVVLALSDYVYIIINARLSDLFGENSSLDYQGILFLL